MTTVAMVNKKRSDSSFIPFIVMDLWREGLGRVQEKDQRLLVSMATNLLPWQQKLISEGQFKRLIGTKLSSKIGSDTTKDHRQLVSMATDLPGQTDQS